MSQVRDKGVAYEMCERLTAVSEALLHMPPIAEQLQAPSHVALSFHLSKCDCKHGHVQHS